MITRQYCNDFGKTFMNTLEFAMTNRLNDFQLKHLQLKEQDHI